MFTEGSFTKDETISIVGPPRLAVGDLRYIERKFRRKPEQTSKTIFTASRVPPIPKTIRNIIIGKMASAREPLKLPHLTPRHKSLELQWTKKSITLDISCILFTDETRETLDGPQSWEND